MSAFEWTDARVRDALGLPKGEKVGAYGRVTTDSRTARPKDLFVALVGDRFDGHDFLGAAAQAGVGGAVVEDSQQGRASSLGLEAYGVPDTLVALGDLARHRRRALDAVVVGITGSSGKTTTKDFASGAVAGHLRTHATEGNLNNRVGLPLTLLAAPDDAQAVLLEMGTNQPGEIGTLTAVGEPEIGVVTTVGEAHLEGLGTLDGVLEEKLSLLGGLPVTGTALVGDEPPSLPEAARSRGRRLRVAGWTERADADLRPDQPTIDEDGRYAWSWRGHPVHLRVPGRAAVTDALLALAVAEELGVPADEAAAGISEVAPTRMRGRVEQIGSLTVLVDCYNANPQSMASALDVLETIPHRGSRVAVLGSMLELGREGGALHRRVLSAYLDSSVEWLALAGEFAEAVSASDPAERLLVGQDVPTLGQLLADRLRGDELVLLKASRGVRLEQVLEPLRAAFETGEG